MEIKAAAAAGERVLKERRRTIVGNEDRPHKECNLAARKKEVSTWNPESEGNLQEIPTFFGVCVAGVDQDNWGGT